MPEAEHADVVVIGAGASGIPAAVGAAREGANVILAEEDDVPGGAPVDNYVTMPCGQPRTGVYREMLNRLDARFCLPVQSDGPVPPLWDRWYMPSSYLTVLTELLNAEPRVRLRCRTRPIQPVLESDRGQPCVRGLIVNGSNGQQHRIDAPVFIDATGDGSLANHTRLIRGPVQFKTVPGCISASASEAGRHLIFANTASVSASTRNSAGSDGTIKQA